MDWHIFAMQGLPYKMDNVCLMRSVASQNHAKAAPTDPSSKVAYVLDAN